jgi:hypothetical protein
MLQAAERAKLEALRSEKVAAMTSMGVNEKYFGEMKNLDIGKILTK